jgi:hypothetical protein
MEAQDYPAVHFERMRELTRALRVLPAQVLDHEYRYESFGSWCLTVRYEGQVAQLVYDGRDSALGLRRSDERKPPYQFGPNEWEAVGPGVRELETATIDEICRVLARRP